MTDPNVKIPKSRVNVNGVVTSAEDAKISVFDRGFLYGDSVYEVTQTYDGVPFLLEEHLDRLWYSAEQLDMNIAIERTALKKQIALTLKELNTPNAYIRIIISRGEGQIGLDPNLGGRHNLVIITKDLPPYPKTWYQHGVHIIIAETLRNSAESLNPNIKSGNYLNNVMAYSEAKKRGAYDSVMLNKQGKVTECTTSNIWMVKNGRFLTPPLSSGLLSGITRRHLIGLCQEHKLDFRETEISPEELLDADEIFITSTTRKVLPITRLNESSVGLGRPGPFTKKLIQLYDEHVAMQHSKDQQDWKKILETL